MLFLNGKKLNILVLQRKTIDKLQGTEKSQTNLISLAFLFVHNFLTSLMDGFRNRVKNNFVPTKLIKN